MRGEDLIGGDNASFDHRITPACAGKTTAGEVGEGTSSDHPRMRGEDG